MALIDDFKNDPAAVKIPLASILARRVHKHGDDGNWQADASHYKFEWRWAGLDLPEDIQEIATDGSSESTLTEVGSIAAVDSTPGTWFFEQTGEGDTGWIHVNQSSGLIGDWYFAVDYYWRLTSHKDRTYHNGVENLHWHARMVTRPKTKRFTQVLASRISGASGSFVVRGETVQERLIRDIIYNRPITIEIVGLTRGQEITYADRITDFVGFTASRSGGGDIKGQALKSEIVINYTDGTSVLEETVPAVNPTATPPPANATYIGRVDQILALLVPGVTIDVGFSAARPYELQIMRQQPQTKNRLIELLMNHLSNFYYRRDGSPYLTWWKAPTGSGAVITLKERRDLIYPNLVTTVDYSNYADLVRVKMGSGWRGTKLFDTAAEKEDEQLQKLSIPGTGWTSHVGYNIYSRTDIPVKLEEFTHTGYSILVPKVGSMAACNTDDNSWTQQVNGVTGVITTYFNPPGGGPPQAFTPIAGYYKKEKDRTATSIPVTGQDDSDEKVAQNLLSPRIYGRNQEKVVNSAIQKSSQALLFAQDYLGFTKQPIEVWELTTRLTLALDLDIMQEFDVELRNGDLVSLVTIGTLSDYNAGSLKLWGWRPHEGIPA